MISRIIFQWMFLMENLAGLSESHRISTFADSRVVFFEFTPSFRLGWLFSFGAASTGLVVPQVSSNLVYTIWLVVSNIWIMFHFIYGMSSETH